MRPALSRLGHASNSLDTVHYRFWPYIDLQRMSEPVLRTINQLLSEHAKRPPRLPTKSTAEPNLFCIIISYRAQIDRLNSRRYKSCRRLRGPERHSRLDHLAKAPGSDYLTIHKAQWCKPTDSYGFPESPPLPYTPSTLISLSCHYHYHCSSIHEHRDNLVRGNKLVSPSFTSCHSI